jgi:hypothetical protein
MKNLASRAGISVAASAAAISVVFAIFVPYGYPWLGLGWAVVACAAGVWVAMISIRAQRPMSDVIDDVEAESHRVAAGLRPEAISTKTIL